MHYFTQLSIELANQRNYHNLISGAYSQAALPTHDINSEQIAYHIRPFDNRLLKQQFVSKVERMYGKERVSSVSEIREETMFVIDSKDKLLDFSKSYFNYAFDDEGPDFIMLKRNNAFLCKAYLLWGEEDDNDYVLDEAILYAQNTARKNVVYTSFLDGDIWKSFSSKCASKDIDTNRILSVEFIPEYYCYEF